MHLRSAGGWRFRPRHLDLDSEKAGGTTEEVIDNVQAAAWPGSVGPAAGLHIGSFLVSAIVRPKNLTQGILRLESLGKQSKSEIDQVLPFAEEDLDRLLPDVRKALEEPALADGGL